MPNTSMKQFGFGAPCQWQRAALRLLQLFVSHEWKLEDNKKNAAYSKLPIITFWKRQVLQHVLLTVELCLLSTPCQVSVLPFCSTTSGHPSTPTHIHTHRHHIIITDECYDYTGMRRYRIHTHIPTHRTHSLTHTFTHHTDATLLK